MFATGQKELRTLGKRWRNGLSGRKLSGDPKRAVHESFSAAYAGAMSTKHINTAADLVRFGASVRIDCGKCGATKTLSGTEMVKACGGGDLKSSQRRLKCSRCRGKEAWLTVLPPI
jgi:ribosomal protein S27AE